ncbi:MAG: bleomycin resistance family protein, partial [Blastocatellia bacterium]|nr:bleomycin resistance family protein [Blastocatellia bacterium]
WPEAGEPCWTCLKKDSIEIMFTSKNAHSKLEDTLMTGSLYLYAEAVDKFWEELKDKVTVEYPIENFDYGMREFAIRDCNGYLLQFGQELPH